MQQHRTYASVTTRAANAPGVRAWVRALCAHVSAVRKRYICVFVCFKTGVCVCFPRVARHREWKRGRAPLTPCILESGLGIVGACQLHTSWSTRAKLASNRSQYERDR